MNNFKLEKGYPCKCGATPLNDGVLFAFESDSDNCGIILKNKKSKTITRIPLSREYRNGNVFSVIIKDIEYDKYLYKFYSDEKEFADPYSYTLVGNEKFGLKKDNYEIYSSIVKLDDFNKDEKPGISFENSIFYLLHVRGFTAHSSSKVENKGTFKGILEKLDYLKDLGITTLELMPCYEFEEFEKISKDNSFMVDTTDYKAENKVNYWGYKEGFYFAPKASYCATNEPVKEFKDFVKTLHKNGIEVVLQFYFPDKVKQHKIYEVLKFWLLNYNVDGFHLKGNKIPFSFIANDPLFGDTKLLYDYIPENEIYEAAFVPTKRNLSSYSDAFMYQMRKVLKGDEGTLKDLVYYTKNYPEKSACVNFITNYYGFTLNDLVSYDRKHNEDNGEKNVDGCDYNFSWNCGIEGKTKKSLVMKLRKKMMKDALFLVFSSKGTPLILAGDEICNTQNGNNNPYCQDNAVSYINWNLTAEASEMLEYTKKLIALRKSDLNAVLNREFSMLDRAHIGYPDLSYHSDEAWKADLATYNRHLGIMYSSLDKGNVTLYYLAYNFYWKEITFSLPFLPVSAKWDVVFSTGDVKEKEEEKEETKQGMKFELESRSCAVFKVTFSKDLLGNK
ncbi:glycogen operon protein [Lachnospiraceae bacterium G41]|nr:glycogen operon protein [Lachnospiraceae bacterium G41]